MYRLYEYLTQINDDDIFHFVQLIYPHHQSIKYSSLKDCIQILLRISPIPSNTILFSLYTDELDLDGTIIQKPDLFFIEENINGFDISRRYSIDFIDYEELLGFYVGLDNLENESTAILHIVDNILFNMNVLKLNTSEDAFIEECSHDFFENQKAKFNKNKLQKILSNNEEKRMKIIKENIKKFYKDIIS